MADLCAGVGGFHLAFKKLNVETTIACEIDKFANITYEHNFPTTEIIPDITQMNGKDMNGADILCAGFPCQPFSIAGHRKGFKDSSGPIFFDIARIAKEAKTPVIFLENVENILRHDNGQTMKTILKILQEDLGYSVSHKVLESRNFGMYQKRRRIIIVGFLDKSYAAKFDLSIPKRNPPSDFDHILDDYNTLEKTFFVRKDSGLNLNYMKMIENKKNPSYIYQFRRRYWREYSDMCPTLTANMGTGGHNVPFIYDSRGKAHRGYTKYRKLTPPEVFKLQGFGLNGFEYSLPLIPNYRLYKQAGNSIPVEMTYEVAKKIIKAIS